jgi:hypothetical protein
VDSLSPQIIDEEPNSILQRGSAGGAGSEICCGEDEGRPFRRDAVAVKPEEASKQQAVSLKKWLWMRTPMLQGEIEGEGLLAAAP